MIARADPDMLEVGNGALSEDEERTHFSLWAIMKAPLLLGCDLAALSPSSLGVLSNAGGRSSLPSLFL